MRIYFDTEFTGLHKNTTLISIGLIDENNRTFYAEFNDYNESQCDDWIKDNVIKNLKFNDVDTKIPGFVFAKNKNVEIKADKKTIQAYLYDWLSVYDSVELISDCCHYDMVLFIDIFGNAIDDLPKFINPVCHDINQDISVFYDISEREAFDVSREDILSSYNYIVDDEIMKHNALYDAQVIKDIYNIIRENGIVADEEVFDNRFADTIDECPTLIYDISPDENLTVGDKVKLIIIKK